MGSASYHLNLVDDHVDHLRDLELATDNHSTKSPSRLVSYLLKTILPNPLRYFISLSTILRDHLRDLPVLISDTVYSKNI